MSRAHVVAVALALVLLVAVCASAVLAQAPSAVTP